MPRLVVSPLLMYTARDQKAWTELLQLFWGFYSYYDQLSDFDKQSNGVTYFVDSDTMSGYPSLPFYHRPY